MRHCRFGPVAVLLASTVIAGPIGLQIDQIHSTADVNLCMSVGIEVCDSDTTPVSGSVTASLDCPAAPNGISLHDFTFDLTEEVVLDLNFGVFGRFSSTGSDVEVTYADPGNPLPATPLVDGVFTYNGVPANAAGQLHYTATGFACTLFAAAGFNCNDVVDLSTIILDPLEMDGTVVVVGDDISLTLQVFISGPIVQTSPGLGTLEILGTIYATGVVPTVCCPGDLTGDDRVDLYDHSRLADCLGGPNAGVSGACRCADLNGNGEVGLDDFADFQVVFQGP